MKMKFLLSTVLLAAALLLSAQNEVVQGLSALDFDRNARGKAAWEQLYVTAVLYPELAYSLKGGDILTQLKREYPTKIKAIGIIPAKLDFVQKFAQQHRTMDITMCADENLTETIKLLGQNFQQSSIFDRSGKLLWSGEAIDLPMMIKRIYSKKYSEREEIRIAALVSALQAALRSGNPRMISQSADMILNLRPEQMSAVNAKAFALENSGDHKALETFFRDRIKRFPNDANNYFMLIEASFRNPAMSGIAPEVAQEYFQKFPQDTVGINAVCWSLLNKLPFNAEAFKAVCAGENILKKSPAAGSSRILATRSLIAYKKCHLRQAIAFATHALNLADTPQDKAFLTELLRYYQATKE